MAENLCGRSSYYLIGLYTGLPHTHNRTNNEGNMGQRLSLLNKPNCFAIRVKLFYFYVLISIIIIFIERASYILSFIPTSLNRTPDNLSGIRN